MIDYINANLTVNCDAEAERAVRFLSGLCAEAYVVCTKPYNPSWCTVDVCLRDCDEEGPYEVGHAEIAVPQKDAPLLRGFIDHALSFPGWSYYELKERAEAYECLERADEEARMREQFPRIVYGIDYSKSLHA